MRRASPLPVSAWVDAGLASGAPPLLPQPAPGPQSLSFEENRVASLAGRQTDETVESQELHTTTEKTGVHSEKADENGGVEDGRLRKKSTSTEEFHPRGGVGQSGAQGRARRASPALSDQRPKILVDEEADVSARNKGRRSGSAGARRGALMTEARGRFGGAEGRGEGDAQGGVGEDAAEVSLDLSDCSEEVRGVAFSGGVHKKRSYSRDCTGIYVHVWGTASPHRKRCMYLFYGLAFLASRP